MDAKYILQKLRRLYSPPKSFLNWKTPLDLLIATLLSAQCTDERVNMVTKALFKKCRTAKDYAGLPRKELEKLIHPCGTFRVKTRHIQGLCRILIERHTGKVPRTIEELTALPGVGRKTALIVLYAAFGKVEGIAVDTHVMRVSSMLGLTKEKTPEKIEKDLMKIFPRKEWGRINTLFISHGRVVCGARKRKCAKCVFMNECPIQFSAVAQ